MTTLDLRPFEEHDRPAIERMAVDVVADGTVFPFENVEGVLEYWFGRSTHVIVAEQDGRVAGSYVLKPVQPGRGSHVCNAGYLVDEGHRGAGVGAALGRHSLEEARRLGYLAMQFNLVVATNAPAVHLWKKLGFRIVAELPRTFRHAELGLVNTYVMFQELEGEVRLHPHSPRLEESVPGGPLPAGPEV